MFEHTAQKGKALSVLNTTDFIFSQIPGLLVVAWRTRTASYHVLILCPWFLIGANAVWSLQPFCFDKEGSEPDWFVTELLLCIYGMLLFMVCPWCCQHFRQHCQSFTFTCVHSWLLCLFLFSWLTACILLIPTQPFLLVHKCLCFMCSNVMIHLQSRFHLWPFNTHFASLREGRNC